MAIYRLHLILELFLGSLHLVVPLPEVEVGGVLLNSQLVAGLLDGVEDGLPQPLGLSHGLETKDTTQLNNIHNLIDKAYLLSQHLVVLAVRVPGLRLNTPDKKKLNINKF